MAGTPVPHISKAWNLDKSLPRQKGFIQRKRSSGWLHFGQPNCNYFFYWPFPDGKSEIGFLLHDETATAQFLWHLHLVSSVMFWRNSPRGCLWHLHGVSGGASDRSRIRGRRPQCLLRESDVPASVNNRKCHWDSRVTEGSRTAAFRTGVSCRMSPSAFLDLPSIISFNCWLCAEPFFLHKVSMSGAGCKGKWHSVKKSSFFLSCLRRKRVFRPFQGFAEPLRLSAPVGHALTRS